LWRRSNPALGEAERRSLVDALMDARRSVGQAQRAGDESALGLARSRVQAAKVALGERGPVWWDDGSPDLNRHMARNTGYAQWYAELETEA
jgi:hypothetical protein